MVLKTIGSNPCASSNLALSAKYIKQINMIGLTTKSLLFLALGFLIGYIFRSVLAVKQLNKQASYSNDFEIEQIQQRDKVRDMVLVKKAPYDSENTDKIPVSSNITMHFKGQVQITGNYFFSGPMGAETVEDLDAVCMSELDEQSLNRLPRPTSKSNDTWFCFDNSDYAFEQFGPIGSKGRATIVIDNYTINIFPSEVHDAASLIRVEK